MKRKEISRNVRKTNQPNKGGEMNITKKNQTIKHFREKHKFKKYINTDKMVHILFVHILHVIDDGHNC
jgi:hypothetical protein